MKRITLVALATLSLSACSQDTIGPASLDLDDGAGAFGTALTAAGGYEAGIYESRLANGLPDDLKLSAEQKEKIRALVKAFEDATRADREALREILRQAGEAGRRGARGDPVAVAIRMRLAAAEAKLKADIDAVLTPEQRAWIATHSPRRCDPSKFIPLSDAQKAQIGALEAAFQQSNKADLDAVKAAYDEVRAALRTGKSREEVARILDPVKPAIARLATARITLRQQITSVLTPEQRASGCLPLG